MPGRQHHRGRFRLAGSGYSETSNNWTTWATAPCNGAGYRYLSHTVGDGSRRGKAIWKPNSCDGTGAGGAGSGGSGGGTSVGRCDGIMSTLTSSALVGSSSRRQAVMLYGVGCLHTAEPLRRGWSWGRDFVPQGGACRASAQISPLRNFSWSFLARSVKKSTLNIHIAWSHSSFCSVIRQWCRVHRHDALRAQQQALARKLRGHYGYFGVSSNFRALERFHREIRHAWRKWLRPPAAQAKRVVLGTLT